MIYSQKARYTLAFVRMIYRNKLRMIYTPSAWLGRDYFIDISRVLGRCDTGKTSLAAHIGEIALRAGERVVYYNVDDFLQIIRNKDKTDKYHRKFNYILTCSVIIIDELMYVSLSEDDLPLFYRAINFIKEERSVIFITNRELSEWQQAAEDKHLMQTLADKISSDSQLIRLS